MQRQAVGLRARKLLVWLGVAGMIGIGLGQLGGNERVVSRRRVHLFGPVWTAPLTLEFE